MLSGEEIENLLKVGHETRGFEIKGPGALTDSHFFAKVVRAVLSMGNLRDGGYVVIGIDDKDPAALKPGLDTNQLESWLDYDTVASNMAVYADPPLHFETGIEELSNGAAVLVIQVHEFAVEPHICGKAFDPVLRKGALYVRSRKLPATVEVEDSVEMRELVDLATEKGVRRFIQTAQRVGLRLDSDATKPGPTGEEKYEDERSKGWS